VTFFKSSFRVSVPIFYGCGGLEMVGIVGTVGSTTSIVSKSSVFFKNGMTIFLELAGLLLGLPLLVPEILNLFPCFFNILSSLWTYG
jgi:hypothetical protein